MIHYDGIFSIEELIQISGKILAKPCLSMVQNEFEKNQLMRTTSDSSYIKCNMFSFTYFCLSMTFSCTDELLKSGLSIPSMCSKFPYSVLNLVKLSSR